MEEPGLRKYDTNLVEQEKGKETETGPPKAKSKGPGGKRAEKRRKINDIAPQEAELPGESGDPVVGFPLGSGADSLQQSKQSQPAGT